MMLRHKWRLAGRDRVELYYSACSLPATPGPPTFTVSFLCKRCGIHNNLWFAWTGDRWERGGTIGGECREDWRDNPQWDADGNWL